MNSSTDESLGEESLVLRRRVGAALFALVERQEVAKLIFEAARDSPKSAFKAIRTLSTCGAILLAALARQAARSANTTGASAVPEASIVGASAYVAPPHRSRQSVKPPPVMWPSMVWPTGTCSRQGSLLISMLVDNALGSKKELSDHQKADRAAKISKILTRQVRVGIHCGLQALSCDVSLTLL